MTAISGEITRLTQDSGEIILGDNVKSINTITTNPAISFHLIVHGHRPTPQEATTAKVLLW